ncbi:preprotein translocase subunit SecA [bacterium]|nr:preprotein translocase subunit SecA [bacterium]
MDASQVWDRVTDGVNSVLEGINRSLTGLFGNSNERHVRRLQPNVARVGEFAEAMQALTDSDLKGVTAKLKARLAGGEKLDDLLPEAFAACRESGKRYLGMRHYDVQLIGGMVLHSGKIAEMVTGEGKTLVATLPAYLNALTGRGVHVVTVNDYLARRDAEWMSPIFTGLGMKVGAIQSQMSPNDRQYHYSCDITYGTNNEFGFDYLRDNMKATRQLQAQKELHYAIIDEVDSILIDEARTPLIISGPAIDDPSKYRRAQQIAVALRGGEHYEVNEKDHTCHLTDEGVLEAERLAGVESFYTSGNMQWPHLIDNSLKANFLYKRDKDYIVDNGEIIIIDEHTGRKMVGRQWSDGLHQAVEAKEGVRVKEENQTLATITFQNFFKLYSKISGMTGTAMTEAQEFYKIYDLDVVAIPTNRSMKRLNHPDVIFCTQKEKWKAVVDEIRTIHQTGRPVLVGTTSIEKSEFVSSILEKSGITHSVLNAKFVEREAEIVAQAGRRGAVTIATNMAGRGTDIILGGNPEAQAWADLKNQYTSRLEIPPEVWAETINKYKDGMRAEGDKIREPASVAELAKNLRVKDPAPFVAAFESASQNEKKDPARLAKKSGLDEKKFEELADLYFGSHPGGLHIVGTERHDSRRIDNQLRGRSGRQGDPGSSRFFLSLEDDLMRIFAGDWVRSLLQSMGMKDGEAIESAMVSRRIEAAQKKVEERHFESRKSLLEYDEIMNAQRKRVYGFRQAILEGADGKDLIIEMLDHEIDKALENFLDRNYGPMAFAAWASTRLGTEFEAKEFSRCDFEQAERIAFEESRHRAEQSIYDWVEDHLSQDVEQREWNWEALCNSVSANYGVKIKPHDLKKMSRNDIMPMLVQQAHAQMEKVDLQQGKVFFEDDFGVGSLASWAEQMFHLGITSDELKRDGLVDVAFVRDKLRSRVREVYQRKEIEFPVHCGMTRFLPDKTKNPNAVYDRDGLVAWAASRFGVKLDAEEFKTMTRDQVESRLQQVSKEFLEKTKFREEIEAEIEKYFPDPKEPVSAHKLQSLSQWSAEHFGQSIEFETPLVYRSTAMGHLYEAGEAKYRPELREIERTLILQFLDTGWKDHLYAMDHLRSGIGLVGYANIDPKVQYKREGRALFERMWESYEGKVASLIFRLEEVDPNFVGNLWRITNVEHEQYREAPPASAGDDDIRQQQDAAIEASKGNAPVEPIRHTGKRVGRNDPCPCGSGKKFKNCCMGKSGGAAKAG